MSNNSHDVLVIGAGPGGYTAAIRLGQYGLNPLVVEKEQIGGVCLNWGCIPTKTLYSATDPLSRLESWREKGVELSGYGLDRKKMANHKDKVVDKLTKGVEKLIKANGGDVMKGQAVMNSPSEAIVKKEDGEETVIEADYVIIATGSTPIELPNFSFDNGVVWNSRDAVRLSEIPDKLVILGAGVIGLEMGTIYNRLGVEVEVLEMADSILPGMNLDKKFSSLLSRELDRSGLKIRTETKATGLEKGSEGYLVVGEKGGESVEYTADRVLSAVGRTPVSNPVTDGLDLDRSSEGYLAVDDRCMTSEEGVYAIGDVVGEPLLAHKATRQGLIAAADIAGEETSQYKAVPAAVFTDPEYAEVGLSRSEAKKKGFDPISGRFPFRASGKALAMGEAEGMVQLVVDESSDRILGGMILGPHASDLIGEIGLAVEMNLTATEVAETIHTHPTLSEAIMEAAENVHGRAIHTGNR
ncbi:MAG: dihydrolipoyl dehydrogenase [Candidatus Bipolaricaulia bacterium]